MTASAPRLISRTNMLTFAGSNPSLYTHYSLQAYHGTTFEFKVPRGGFLTTPLTTRTGVSLGEDADLTVDVSEFLRGMDEVRVSNLRLINADSEGYHYNKISVSGDDENNTKLKALVARWNASMPTGARVYLSEGPGEPGGAPGLERCELWLEVKKAGMVIYIK